MSEQDESRPLTRRERRLREMGQAAGAGAEGTGAADARTEEPGSAAAAQPEEAAPPSPASPQAPEASPVAGGSPEDDIEVSLYDENGRPRTRREIRELREKATAARLAEQESAEPIPTASAEEKAAEPEPPSADTEPFTRADLREAQRAGSAEGEPEQPDASAFPPTMPFTSADIAEAEETDAETSDDATDPVDAVAPAAPSPGPEPPTADDTAETASEADVEPDPAPQPAQRSSSGYSFPDIVPPEEQRSIFDDPASRSVPDTAEEGGFDELISRAVVQESATDVSTDSALILPEMPEGSSLSGSLGETGELYVTGSIHLPKSLGETGGHSALHDSVDFDPLEALNEESRVAGRHDSGPVSARTAVSARVPEGSPVVTGVKKKDRSKLPIVLSLTGGVLFVGVVGFLVWGASTGLFG